MNLGKLGADDPMKVGEVTLVPVWEFHSYSMVRGDGGSFVGMKRAKAVVALTPRGAVALDLEGGALSLNELLDEVPGLKELVAEADLSVTEEKG